MKVLVLAAVALSASSLSIIGRNVAIAVAGLALAVALLAYAMRRRRGDDACVRPAAGRPGAHPDDNVGPAPTSTSST